MDAVDIHNPIVAFVSSPVIALLIGLVGTSFVGRYAIGAQAIQHAIVTGFKESGQILILTGVGGSLATTIKATGLGDILGEYFTATTAAPLLMVWGIAAVLHIAVGFGDHLGDHLGRHPGARRADHRHRSGADCAGRGRGLVVRGARHEQHLLAAGHHCWARPREAP